MVLAAYEAPPVEELLEFVLALNQSYSRRDNPQRLFFINFCVDIAGRVNLHDKSRHEEKLNLLSVLLFEFIFIESLYNWAAPEGNWVCGGSSMYRLLKAKLNITIQNALTPCDRIIYLSRLYNLVKNEISDERFAKLQGKTKDIYLHELKTLIIKVIQSQTDMVKHLLEEPPSYTALCRNIEKLITNYKPSGTGYSFFSSDEIRKAIVNFIDFIYQTCKQIYTDPTVDTIDFQTNILLGAVWFALMKIRSEYKLFSPERSTLFEACKAAINITNIESVSAAKKDAWLAALFQHIQIVKTQHAKIIREWQNKKFTYLDEFTATVKVYLAHDPSKVPCSRDYVSTVATSAAKCGLGFTASAVGNLLLPGIGATLIAAAGGPIGAVIFGATGTILATQLGRMVAEGVIPAALASVYGQVLGRIGSVIGRTAMGAVTLTFTVTTQGLRSLLGFYEQILEEDEEYLKNKAWINALLNLPDDIFAKEKKDIIYLTQDLEQPQRLALTN